MKIEIPLRPVSVNEAWQGRRFKTEIYKIFCEQFYLIAPKKKMIKGIVQIEYRFYMKNHKMADYDNVIKTTQDMLVKCGYIEDDRKIYKATQYKIPSEEDKIEVEIKKYKLK